MCNSTGVTRLCHQGRRTVPAVSGLDLPAVAAWRDEGGGRSR
jgi:hypothetical protein